MWRRHHARPRPRLLAALIACIAALAAFALSAGTAAAAPPANDDFANAALVPVALPSTQSGTLEEATAESGEPDHTGTTFFSGRHTVWYRWTPAASATVVIQTCGSAAFSSAAVYTGSSVGGLSSKLGSTTDCGNGTSTTLSAVGGTTYRIGIENNTVGNGAPGAYTLRILQKGTISGTVTAAGAPVGNFCVSAIDPQTGMAGDTATTSGTGAYTLTLLPGDYKVGFAPCTSGGPHARQFYDGAVKIDDASVISLGSGGSRTGVNASLKAASSIAGTVTGEGGFPVPGACVQAFDPDHPSKAVATGSSDFGGQYVISNLAATDYIVRFSTDCGSGGPLKPEFYDDALTFGSADPVTLAVGQARTGIDASLGDGGSISGIIRNDLGDPVEDICVIATAPGIEGAQSTQSAADGTYSLTGLDPGDYTLEFEDCNGLDYVTEYYDNSPVAGGADPVAVAREADVTAVNATLARRGAIEGTVTLPGGGPADSACVTAFDAEGNGVASGSTDASGRYRVEGLQPGNYRIHFFPCIGGNLLGVYYDGKPDLDSANPVVVIAGQTTSSIDAQLASAGSISGTVTAAGQPAVGVCPEALDSSGGVVSGGGTDADGNYTIGGLEAGSYRVVFRDCDGGNLATEFYDDKPTFQSANAVNVTAGANTANVDAQLAAGGSISGTITDGAAPAGDVCVSAYNVADSSVPISNGVSGADGQYTVTGLAAGSYKVHFDGGCAGDLSAEYYDDAASFAAADVVTVTGTADTANINGSLTAGTLPSATISGGPNGATNNPAPTFTFSTTGAGTIQCSLDQGTPSFGSCSGAGSHTPATNLADGAWTFRVRVTNSAGQDTKTRSFSVDTQPPALLISGGPTGPTNLKRPTFSFDAESGSGVQCSIDAGAANFGSCSATSSHQPTTDLGDGSYTFRVRATDAAGNTRTQTRSFTVDTVAPISTISAGPENGSTIGTSTTQFVFSADEANATIYCSIDNGVYGPCTSPKELSGLTDGPHSFKIAAVDAAVNTGPVVSRSYTVDTVPPSLTIDGGPSGPISNKRPSFTFTAEGGSTTTRCSISTGADSYGPCSATSSHQPPTDLADGSYAFRVKSTDAGGNVTVRSRTFTIDTVAPISTISAGPANGSTIGTSTTQFVFSADEANATIYCSIDNGVYGPCTSPKELSGLTNGPHSFKIAAVDAASNTGPVVSRSYTVDLDTTPPQTTIDSGPGEGSTITTASATFAFSSNESGSTFECKLDGAAFSGCTSPKSLSGLANGSHTFSVRATDGAGNVDASPATRTFTVDRDITAPETTIDSGPSGTIMLNAAAFEFSSSESGSTFECKLDAGGFAGCGSPKVLTGLANGSHTFSVRAIDAVGNVDASPASQTFTVSVTAPPPTPPATPPVTPPASTPPSPDTGACDAAKAKQSRAAGALKKAKAKAKKAEGDKAKKKKAKAKVKKAKSAVKKANQAVQAAC